MNMKDTTLHGLLCGDAIGVKTWCIQIEGRQHRYSVSAIARKELYWGENGTKASFGRVMTETTEFRLGFEEW